MLNNVLETKITEFSSLEEAHRQLSLKDFKQVILPASRLKVTEDGLLQSESSEINGYVHARMTDFSLKMIHDALKIPHTYAQRLEPPLHATNINELLQKRVSPLTVTVECDLSKPANSEYYVVAVLPSQSMAIPHQVILEHLIVKKITGHAIFTPGYMEVRIAQQDEIEVLPSDVFSIEGSIINSQLGLKKFPFEISCFLTRLVCANGMVTRRNLLSGRIPLWTQNPKTLTEYIDRQLNSTTEMIAGGLKRAVATMSSTNLGQDEQDKLKEDVRKTAGVKFLEKLFEKAQTAYEHLNEITELANKLEDRERKRRLWILGGGMIEGYLEGN